MADRRALPPIRRVVVKLGTRVLVDGDGRLDAGPVATIAPDRIAAVRVE